MHQEFRELLKTAKGVQEFVIAVNIDIRGFSKFSMTVESPEVAIFIKKFYEEIIDNYFTDASFFKPMGDGLLIIISIDPYTKENLIKIATKTIKTCLAILENFDSLYVNDPLINFKTPKHIGIGVARGSACRLISQGKILDYSGQVLNHASRLMNMARPSGIVFDINLGIDFLPNELTKLFSKKDGIYVRGIAEMEPIEVCYTKKYTQIPPSYTKPIDKTTWKQKLIIRTLKEIKDAPSFIYDLPNELTDPSQIAIKVTYPAVTNGKMQNGLVSYIYYDKFHYSLEPGRRPVLRVVYDKLIRHLEAYGIKDDWKIEIEILCPEN